MEGLGKIKSCTYMKHKLHPLNLPKFGWRDPTTFFIFRAPQTKDEEVKKQKRRSK
jgi:hypothetical protein